MKNLIKDILTYLKENDEARERFNRIIRRDCVHSSITIIKSTDGVRIFYPNSDTLLLIHALSSPNKKPICGFLEEKRMIGWTFGMEIINHASTLFNLLTKQIEKGKSFDKILIKLNDKYNEII